MGIEHLLETFPARRIFLLDWPGSGASPRIPWTVEAKDSFFRKHPKRPCCPVHEGVVYIADEDSGRRSAYPLPEKRFVAMIEEWRKYLGLSKMVVVGHSLGGYIAFNYAEAYPEFVEHLILV